MTSINKTNLFTILFGFTVISEFSLLFYFQFFGYQIKFSRILQILLISFFIYSLFLELFNDFKKKKFSLKILKFNTLDFFFTFFLVFIFFSYFANFQHYKLHNINFINIVSEILKYAVYYLVYVFILRYFYIRFYIYSFYKIIYFFVIFTLSIGYIEFLFSFITDHNFIPRQLNYGINDDFIGHRFHSVFGEPRDAAVNLIALISLIISLEIFIFKKIKSYLLIYILLFSSFLTFATTFVIILILFFFIHYFYTYNKIYTYVIYIPFGLTVLAMVLFNDRINSYTSDIFLIETYIQNKDTLKNINISNQLSNIIPLYLFIKNAFDLNYISIFFGNGIKSSSFIQYQAYINPNDNPHSQLSRLIYENGIIGLMLYIKLLNFYLKYLIKFYLKYQIILNVIFIGFVACTLAQRTGIMFILLGISNFIYLKTNKEYSIIN